MPERSSYPDGEPCWADVTTPDLEAAQRFYNAVFGWEYQNSGPEFGNYSMCLKDGRPVAGLTPPPPGAEGAPPMWNMYLASSDVDETARRIERGGGKIMMAPMDIPGSGRMVYAFDPTGAVFGAWQGGGHTGAQLTQEPGTPCWAEVNTRDAVDYTIWNIDGRPVAGRMKLGDDTPAEMPAQWLVSFAVEDADAAVQRVTDNGGQVQHAPVDSPYGRYAVVTDLNGAAFGLIDLSKAQQQQSA